jgi:hypothetical protein
MPISRSRPPVVETEPRITVRAGDAYELALLLQLGIRHARSDGWRPSPRTAELVEGFEYLWATRQAPPPAMAVLADDGDERIGSAEAAALLGITERQVRNLAPRIPRSLQRGRVWTFSRAEIVAEAEARNTSEVIGKAQ